MQVKKTENFKIDGAGTAENWTQTEWINLSQLGSSTQQLQTKAKILYSDSGIYFLFSSMDHKLSAYMNADFMDLWKEDVVEVFLWPDETEPVYFEYEISPLNYELPLLISNQNGDLVRWKPFHYEQDRKTAHATTVQGGTKNSGASISSWMAEFFIPFKLLRPLKNVPPSSGSLWRANLYRVDYDKEPSYWAWQETDKSFHEYEKFGFLWFE